MLLIALSDIHDDIGNLSAIANDLAAADLVLLPGDLTNLGGRDAAARVVDAVRTINSRVRAVSGNCDMTPEVDEYLEREGLLLHGRCEVIGGLAFWGCGGSLPCPSRTPNECSEKELAAVLAKAAAQMPEGMPSVLVVHQPPFETTADFASIGKHVGSKAVRESILKHKPAVCLTGHIHEGKGIDALGQTTIVNPGPLRAGGYARILLNGKCLAEIRDVRKATLSK